MKTNKRRRLVKRKPEIAGIRIVLLLDVTSRIGTSDRLLEVIFMQMNEKNCSKIEGLHNI
jgi:hypothetical protein